MKKIILSLVIICSLLFISGCKDENIENELSDAQKFKEEYESLNNQENKNGLKHRNVEIDEDNPFVYISAEDLVKKFNDGDTFYVYFGSKLCPWCRSAIEVAISEAKNAGIKTIYYVDIWDNDGDEILRDKYIINEDKKLEKVVDGTDAYYDLLKFMDKHLEDYTLTNEDGKTIDVKEKRIYAPNFVYVENGTTKSIIQGTSDKQKDSRETLTEEMINDEKEMFKEFYEN